VEEPRFSRDYHDPDKRSIANAVSISSTTASRLPEALVEVSARPSAPAQGRLPLLVEKFRTSLGRVFAPKQAGAILDCALTRKGYRPLRARIRRHDGALMQSRDPCRTTSPPCSGRFEAHGHAASRQRREFFTMSRPD